MAKSTLTTINQIMSIASKAHYWYMVRTSSYCWLGLCDIDYDCVSNCSKSIR